MNFRREKGRRKNEENEKVSSISIELNNDG